MKKTAIICLTVIAILLFWTGIIPVICIYFIHELGGDGA